MIEIIVLFAALFIIEVILEVDNLTALRRAAEGLPERWSRGQDAHTLALVVRVAMAYLLFRSLSYFSKVSAGGGHGLLEALGGAMIVLMAAGLIINYFYGSKAKGKARGNGGRGSVVKKTNLISFLVADAFLSLDTVIAAVAMTTNFALAMTAMVSAALSIMAFHKPLQRCLQLNPRLSLIAFVVIGCLGINLILHSQGFGMPKYALLLVVFVGLWLDKLEADARLKRAQAAERKISNGAGGPSRVPKGGSRFVESVKPVGVGIGAGAVTAVVTSLAVAQSPAVGEQEDYVFGTSHSAGVGLGRSGAISLGEATGTYYDSADGELSASISAIQQSTIASASQQSAIVSAGEQSAMISSGQQSAIISTCQSCGRYRFYSPQGGAPALPCPCGFQV